VELVPATVERTEVQEHRGRRRDDYFVHIRQAETATFRSSRQPVRVEVESGDFDRFRQGQTVTATMWGRGVTRLSPPDGEDGADTTDSPLRAESDRFVLGPVVTLAGAFCWWTTIRMRRQSGSWRERAQFPESERIRPLGWGTIAGIVLAVFTLFAGVVDLVPILSIGVIGFVLGTLLGVALNWLQTRRSG
jgi:hypothetical protein